MSEKEFLSLLEKNGLSLNEKQLQQFKKYFELLTFWNKKFNLTAITEEKEVYEKHFFDSLTICFNRKLTNETICDIGSGAGFPSIPLKIVFPNLKITAIDSTEKKVNFINMVCKELGLKDIVAICARAENFAKENIEKFDIVTARAVAQLNILMELAAKMIKINGLLIAYKGANAKTEILQSENASKTLFLSLVENQNVILPITNAKRYNIIYRKVKSTPDKYPREYHKIKKKPL